MKRILHIVCAVGAVVVLMAYFFGDLNLSQGPEMMSWEDFSADPRAVAKFRDRVAATEAAPVSSEADLRRAYDRYVANVNQSSASAAGLSGVSSEYVSVLKSRWQRVYVALAPKPVRRGAKAQRTRLTSSVFRERIGMGVCLALLVGGVVGLTAAANHFDSKSRA